jgi:hypothetical protein
MRYDPRPYLTDVRRLVALKDGRLQLSLEDGWTVEVPAGSHYEACQLHGRDGGVMLISTPGGKLASFLT